MPNSLRDRDTRLDFAMPITKCNPIGQKGYPMSKDDGKTSPNHNRLADRAKLAEGLLIHKNNPIHICNDCMIFASRYH